MIADDLVRERLVFAKKHYSQCMLCEHRCGVDRSRKEQGFCKASDKAYVFRHRVECGEEIQLIPSHLFYLSGCDINCAFCIGGEEVSNAENGQHLTAHFLSEALKWGNQYNTRNIQWVGGEPTIHIPAILSAMADCSQMPPIVWKSNFHATPEAMHLLDGVVDIYVADFKFGNSTCARRIAGVNNYFQIITRNLLIAAGQADLIIRHLLLPGHLACCFSPIVEWIKNNMPDVKFSIRDGYMPCWKANSHSELTSPLHPMMGKQAQLMALEAGLNVIT